MRDSIHKYFQIGAIQWMSHPHRESLESIKSFACDEYFDALEITKIEDEEIVRTVAP